MDVQQKAVVSADGTRLTYYVLQTSAHPRATWVSAPAMGAPLISMMQIYERLPDLRIVTWDMRGFHRSGGPPDENAYAIPFHVQDMEAVVHAEQLDRFLVGGWSMGVPTSLEYAAKHAEHIRGLLLIAGPFEPDLGRPIPIPGLPSVVKTAIDLIGNPVGRAVNPLSVRLLGMRGAGRALGALNLLSREHDKFETVLAEFKHIDWARYFKVIRWLHEHDARPFLPKIKAPTLVVVGDRDKMTPVAVARRLAAGVGQADLCIVPGGTHYMPAEYPEVVADRILKFLDERLSDGSQPCGREGYRGNEHPLNHVDKELA